MIEKLTATAIFYFPLGSHVPAEPVPVRDGVDGEVVGTAVLYRSPDRPTTVMADIDLDKPAAWDNLFVVRDDLG